MISLLAFYLMWADRQGWEVPEIHCRALIWLERRGDLAVLRCFRGFGKSTLLAIYNAWCYYNDPTYRILHQSESDPTAYKTSRDTLHVLMNHPLTKGIVPKSTGTVESWWTVGATDPRNASFFAKGILSNVTSARADECQNDDVETMRNTTTPELIEKMNHRLTEQTHILVPRALHPDRFTGELRAKGGKKLFIGTPHSFNSLYDRVEAQGADCLTIPMYAQSYRIEDAKKRKLRRFDVGFVPVHVFSGIYNGAAVLVEGRDYTVSGTVIEFATPPDLLIDVCGQHSWPERFNREEMEKRRRECKTIGEWDSQYQLIAKPIEEVRLDPDRIREYDCEPVIHTANRASEMRLGNVRIVGASCYWDVAVGKIDGDASVLALVFTDANGHLYLHLCERLTGEYAEFDENDQITGGQVVQARELIKRYNIPSVVVETAGVGSFAGKLLKQALKGMRVRVEELHPTNNKQLRILEALEAPISGRFLWAHSRVLDGPFYEQCRSFNPKATTQPDDFIDAPSGAILATPTRIGSKQKASEARPQDWRPASGVYEAQEGY